jgi:hypothetical protein
LENVLEALLLWSAKFIGLAVGGAAINKRRNGFCHITHKDWLEYRVAAADQGERWRETGHVGKLVEEIVLGAKDD